MNIGRGPGTLYKIGSRAEPGARFDIAAKCRQAGWNQDHFLKSLHTQDAIGLHVLSGVHPSIGVGTVWRGNSASGGWRCLPSLGETQCRRQAWPYGGIRQLGRVRGQALVGIGLDWRDVVGLDTFE